MGLRELENFVQVRNRAQIRDNSPLLLEWRQILNVNSFRRFVFVRNFRSRKFLFSRLHQYRQLHYFRCLVLRSERDLFYDCWLQKHFSFEVKRKLDQKVILDSAFTVLFCCKIVWRLNVSNLKALTLTKIRVCFLIIFYLLSYNQKKDFWDFRNEAKARQQE